MLKVVGADVVSVGDFDVGEGDEAVLEEDIAAHRYRKLVVRQGALRGAILIGWPEWIELVNRAVKAGRDLGVHLDAWRVGDWRPLQSWDAAGVGPRAAA